MEDRSLVCADCGEAFPFTVAEQEFFRAQGFTNDPKRCMECRRARKRSRGAPGGGPPRGRPPGGGGGGDQRTVRVRRVRGEGGGGRSAPPGPARQSRMHDAVCSDCGSETQVPFEPDGVRPVYCLPCLKKTTR